MLSHVIPQCLVTDRIPIKLQLTGKSRLIFKFTDTPAALSTVQICHADEQVTHRNIKQNIMNGGYSTIFDMNILVVHHALSAP